MSEYQVACNACQWCKCNIALNKIIQILFDELSAILVFQNLADGAAINPVSKILATHMGCSAGIGKICFTKNVLSSTTCHKSTNWNIATKRIQLQLGSNQRLGVQLSGVNYLKRKILKNQMKNFFHLLPVRVLFLTFHSLYWYF